MIGKGDIEELFNLLDHKYELGGVFCKFPYILTKDKWIKPDYLSSFSRGNIFNAGMYITYLNKWRENKYDICSSKDINSISSEILSLPQTINLSTLK